MNLFFPFSFLAILTIFPTDVLYDLSPELHNNNNNNNNNDNNNNNNNNNNNIHLYSAFLLVIQSTLQSVNT